MYNASNVSAASRHKASEAAKSSNQASNTKESYKTRGFTQSVYSFIGLVSGVVGLSVTRTHALYSYCSNTLDGFLFLASSRTLRQHYDHYHYNAARPCLVTRISRPAPGYMRRQCVIISHCRLVDTNFTPRMSVVGPLLKIFFTSPPWHVIPALRLTPRPQGPERKKEKREYWRKICIALIRAGGDRLSIRQLQYLMPNTTRMVRTWSRGQGVELKTEVVPPLPDIDLSVPCPDPAVHWIGGWPGESGLQDHERVLVYVHGTYLCKTFHTLRPLIGPA